MTTLQQQTIQALSGGNQATMALIRATVVKNHKVKVGRQQRGVAASLGQFWAEGNGLNQKELASALSIFTFFGQTGSIGDTVFTSESLGEQYRLVVQNNQLAVLVSRARYQSDLMTGEQKIVDYELDGELMYQEALLKAWARENSRLEEKRNKLPLGTEVPPWLEAIEFAECRSRWQFLQAMLTNGGVYLWTLQDPKDALSRLIELAQNDFLMKLGVPFEALIAKGE